MNVKSDTVLPRDPPSQYSTTNYTLVHVAYVASYSATVEVSSYGKKTDDQDLEF